MDLALGLRERGVSVNHVHTRFRRVANLFGVSADIVHTTIPFPFRTWRKPVVATIKGDYTAEPNVLRRFYPRLVAEADVVTTPSEYLKQRLEMDRAVVIPNAVWPEKYQPAIHMEKNRPNLVTVINQSVPEKVWALHTLCFLLERANLPPHNYTVVGCDRFSVEKRLSIRFMGYLLFPEQVLSWSDIFLYYSFQDNFPNAILEAMACGLPVVTNRVGAVGEIIEHGVDGFVARDPDEYVDIVKRLMADRDLRETIGHNAMSTVYNRFNWETILPQYMALYKGLES